jgi:aerobic-type carbon monoxide dehydrogenase small subunit (CoxS/CutS family)
MSATACIAEGHAGSDDEIREWMSGNICRCAAYPQIVAAVAKANGQIGAGTIAGLDLSVAGGAGSTS